ncbi:MAG TPA: glycosyltransferase family 39 protein [Chloroflexota bacterium]|jgi:hypothetical protein
MTVTLRITPLQFLLVVSLGLYLAAMALVKMDAELTFRWVAFALDMLAVLLVLAPYVRDKWRYLSETHAVDRRDAMLLGPLIAFTALVGLIFLRAYPLVSTGDELRDGGLQAVFVYDGTMRNIFAWGTHEAHGLIIPIITGAFLPIFGHTVYAYRVPGVLLACADVALVYLLVRVLLNRTAAFWSSLVLATLTLHWFYSRTQVLLMFNTFWTIVLLVMLWFFWQRRNVMDYAALGTVIGFASGFHVAARVVAMLVLLFVCLMEARSMLRLALKGIVAYEDAFRGAVLLVFWLVGYGPRLWFTTREIFFYAGGSALESRTSDLAALQQSYLKSLLGIVYEPLSSMDPKLAAAPMLTPILALCFVLGIGYAFFVLRNRFLNGLLVLLLVLPMSNSTLTNLSNIAHRYSPLFPLVAIFTGLGITYLLSRLTSSALRYAGAAVAGVYLVYSVTMMFVNQPLDTGVDATDYLAMETIYFLADRPAPPDPATGQAQVCVTGSPKLHTTLGAAHWQEALQYFLPHLGVEPWADAAMPDNEVLIQPGACGRDPAPAAQEFILECRPRQQLWCPRDYSGDMIIHY